MNNKENLYAIVEQQSLEYDKHEHVCAGQTWTYHIKNVIRIGMDLAIRRGADVEVVEISALFHDYANLVDFEKYSDTHHIASGELAEPILIENGYENDFVKKVKKCIFSHRGSVVHDKLSVEEICLADADAMAHLQNIFQVIMWMGQNNRTIEDGNKFVKTKIQKSFAKLSPPTKDLMQKRYDAIMEICY